MSLINITLGDEWNTICLLYTGALALEPDTTFKKSPQNWNTHGIVESAVVVPQGMWSQSLLSQSCSIAELTPDKLGEIPYPKTSGGVAQTEYAIPQKPYHKCRGNNRIMKNVTFLIIVYLVGSDAYGVILIS